MASSQGAAEQQRSTNMSVGRICVREVDLADATECVMNAAQRMHDRNVGSLVVVDPRTRPVGILTDRDLATRVVAKGLDAVQTTVAEVMSHGPESVDQNASIEDALCRMRSGPHRRLTVVDTEGRLVGLLSLDDILDLLSEEFAQIGRLVRRESPAGLAEV
jgi:CBS domain-containing protein